MLRTGNSTTGTCPVGVQNGFLALSKPQVFRRPDCKWAAETVDTKPICRPTRDEEIKAGGIEPPSSPVALLCPGSSRQESCRPDRCRNC